MALASYERSLVAGDSPFDRYRYVDETTQVTVSGHCEADVTGVFDVARRIVVLSDSAPGYRCSCMPTAATRSAPHAATRSSSARSMSRGIPYLVHVATETESGTELFASGSSDTAFTMTASPSPQ